MHADQTEDECLEMLDTAAAALRNGNGCAEPEAEHEWHNCDSAVVTDCNRLECHDQWAKGAHGETAHHNDWGQAENSRRQCTQSMHLPRSKGK